MPSPSTQTAKAWQQIQGRSHPRIILSPLPFFLFRVFRVFRGKNYWCFISRAETPRRTDSPYKSDKSYKSLGFLICRTTDLFRLGAVWEQEASCRRGSAGENIFFNRLPTRPGEMNIQPRMFPKSKSRGKNDFFRRGIIRMLPLCKPKGSRAAGFFFLDLITQNPRWSVSEVRRNECGVKNCHDYFMRRTSSSLLFSRFSAKGSRRVCGPLLSK